MHSYLTFLSRNKAYTAINILGLSLSMMFVILIGVYTWQEYHVNTQFPKASRILVYGIEQWNDSALMSHCTGGHWRLQQYLRSRYPEIESSCALYGGKNELEPGYIDRDGQRVQYPTLCVDSTFFTMLDIPMVLGDARTALNDTRCAVVTDRFARRVFGSPQQAMGRQLRMEGRTTFRITGITAGTGRSSFPETDIYVRFEVAGMFNSYLTDSNMSNATGAELLLLERPGAHLEQKVKDLDNYQKQFFWIFSLPNGSCHTFLTPLSKFYFSQAEYSPVLLRGDQRLVNALLAVGLVILLFAVFNYVNLTNALADKRAREMAMRRLVGASRRDIIVRLIGESVLLCTFSMAVALLMAWAATPYTERLLDTTLLPSQEGAALSTVLPLLLMGLVGGGILGAVAGLLPASVISKAKPIDIVRGTFHFQTHQRLTKVFIIIQNTATITLVAMALGMSSQIHYMMTAWRGYNTHNLIEVPLGFNGATGDDRKALDAWYDGLRQLPQVTATTACMGTPHQGGNNSTFVLDGKTISSQVLMGDSCYMKMFGLKATHLTGLRDKGGSKVYVNRQMLAEEGLPIDSRYYYRWANASEKDRQNVSGVLDDFTIRGLDSEQHPLSLTITDSARYWQWSTVIEVQGDPVTAYESVQGLFQKIFRVPLDLDTPFLDQQIANEYKNETRMATILRLFALIAMVISALGLVAMSTYYIDNHRREMSIRKIFGSTSGEVARRFVTRFLAYVGIAFCIAAPLTVWLYRAWVEQYSHRATWWPWIPIAGLAVLVVSYAAVAVQTWKAARQNPADNIKQE